MADHRHKRETEARRKPKALASSAPLAVLATAIRRDHRRPGRQPGRVATFGAAQRAARNVLRAASADRSESRSPGPSPASRPPRRGTAAVRRRHVEGRDHRGDQGRRSKRGPPTTSTSGTSPATRPSSSASSRPARRSWSRAARLWGRTEIVHQGRVPLGHRRLPVRREAADARRGDCTNGSTVPSGVSDNIATVHDAVCANFPEITSYGTLRGGGGDHAQGRAVDIMVSGERAGRSRTSSARTPPRSVSATSSSPAASGPWSAERGLAGHVQPRVDHRQPLRPRPRERCTETRRSSHPRPNGS